MSTHTPGPWLEGPTEGIGQRGKLIVVDAKGLKVADCEADLIGGGIGFRRPYAEDTANARLIAAAPELLAACIAFMAKWQVVLPAITGAFALMQIHGGMYDGPTLEAELKQITDAIAKAEGR